MILFANKNESRISNVQLLMLFFPLFAIICLWYSPWQTQVIYGDDLGTFQAYRFQTELEMIRESQKYRPVNTWLIRFLIATLGKHVSWHFYFNAAMQAVYTLVFIRLANLLVKNKIICIAAGSLVALSRFNFYNLTQLYNGGAMEVPALIFLTGSIIYWLKATLNNDNGTNDNGTSGFRYMLLAILLANLSIYTHERYLVLLPFLLVSLVVPHFVLLSNTQKSISGSLIILSAVANFFIKQVILHISFFVGTGHTNISFDPTRSLQYFGNAVADLFQFNSGPDYLSGLPYAHLDVFYQILPIITSAIVIFTIGSLLLKSSTHTNLDHKRKTAYIIIALLLLALLSLGPAVATIRLEQRWLQASFALLMVVLAAGAAELVNKRPRLEAVVFVFVAISLLCEGHYLDAGVRNMYISNSVHKAVIYKKAIDNNTIQANSKRLYILDVKNDTNSQNETRWVLQDSAFFDYYSTGSKQISFIDSQDLNNLQITNTPQLPFSQVIIQNNDSVYCVSFNKN